MKSDEDPQPWWRDVCTGLGIALNPMYRNTLGVTRLRFRWGLIVVGFFLFRGSRETAEPNTALHLALAAGGLWVLVMAMFWNPRGALPWWKSPRNRI